MRERSLDGLRGLAALSVVFHHWLYCFPLFWTAGFISPYTIVKIPPIHPFVNGNGAVLVFYVLSGLVLSLGLQRAKEGFSYSGFMTNRFLRIWPAFCAAILLAALLAVLSKDAAAPALSAWFNESWNEPITPGLILGHLAMIDVPPFETLDNVMWSLVVEMRVAIVMPLIFWAVAAAPRRTIGALALLSVLAHLGSLAVVKHSPLSASWLDTVRYIVLFAAGSGIAIYRNALESWLKRLPFAFWAILAAYVLVAYGLPVQRSLRLYAVGPAAICIVLFSYTSIKAKNFLEFSPFLYLGKISYSLYLIHIPIIIFLMRCFYGIMPTGILFFVMISASLISADILYRIAEAPSHRLARSASGWLAGRRRPEEVRPV